jgi:hypothetical protein
VLPMASLDPPRSNLLFLLPRPFVLLLSLVDVPFPCTTPPPPSPKTLPSLQPNPPTPPIPTASLIRRQKPRSPSPRRPSRPTSGDEGGAVSAAVTIRKATATPPAVEVALGAVVEAVRERRVETGAGGEAIEVEEVRPDEDEGAASLRVRRRMRERLGTGKSREDESRDREAEPPFPLTFPAGPTFALLTTTIFPPWSRHLNTATKSSRRR